MKFCLSMFLVTALMTKMVSGHSDTSLWDIIPGTAQIKSLFQLVVGDTSGAKKTQLNFLNEGLGPAQLRSVYFFATGEPKKALEVQEKFVSNLEPLVDSLPVVGHIKGGIHLLTGDQQHGWDAIKSATSTTGTIVGGMVSGPFGAIGGHLLTDMAISSANLVLNGQNANFHGVAEYIKNIYKKDSGEHFDALAGMAIDGYTGSKTKVKDSKVASQEIEAESISNSVRELERGMTFNKLMAADVVESSKTQSGFDNPAFTQEEIELHPLEDDVQKKTHTSQKLSAEDIQKAPHETEWIDIYKFSFTNEVKTRMFNHFVFKDPEYAYLHLDTLSRLEIEKRSFEGLNSYADESVLNKLNKKELLNDLHYLKEEEALLVTEQDFRTVNTDKIEADTTLSTFAGIVGDDVKTLKKKLSKNCKNPKSYVQELEKHYEIKLNSVYDDIHGLNELNYFLIRYLSSIMKDFKEQPTLIMTEKFGTEETNARVLKAKVIENDPTPVKVMIDFSTPGFLETNVPNPYRFLTFIQNPKSTFKIYAIDMMKSKYKQIFNK